MRRSTMLAAGAAVLLGTAGAAANGGSPSETAPPPPPPPPQANGGGYTAPTPPPAGGADRYDWSGLYAGVQGGWLWGENQVSEIGFLPGPVDDDGPLPYDSDGYALGGVLGVNLQSGHWVYGVEAGAAYADFSGERDRGLDPLLGKNVDVLGSLRVRVGFALDRILVYGAGGLGIGYVHMEAVDVVSPGLDTISGNKTSFGYTYGGGVEVGLWGNWSAGAEYSYTDLGETEHDGFIAGSDFTYPHTNEFHAVRARLTYRVPL